MVAVIPWRRMRRRRWRRWPAFVVAVFISLIMSVVTCVFIVTPILKIYIILAAKFGSQLDDNDVLADFFDIAIGNKNFLRFEKGHATPVRSDYSPQFALDRKYYIGNPPQFLTVGGIYYIFFSQFAKSQLVYHTLSRSSHISCRRLAAIPEPVKYIYAAFRQILRLFAD